MKLISSFLESHLLWEIQKKLWKLILYLPIFSELEEELKVVGNNLQQLEVTYIFNPLEA